MHHSTISQPPTTNHTCRTIHKARFAPSSLEATTFTTNVLPLRLSQPPHPPGGEGPAKAGGFGNLLPFADKGRVVPSTLFCRVAPSGGCACLWYRLAALSKIVFSGSFIPSYIPSFLPSSIYPFLPSYPFRPSYVPSCLLPFFLPFFLQEFRKPILFSPSLPTPKHYHTHRKTATTFTAHLHCKTHLLPRYSGSQ